MKRRKGISLSTSSTFQSSSDLHFCLSYQIFLKIMFFKLRNLSLKTEMWKIKLSLEIKSIIICVKLMNTFLQKCLTDESQHKEKSCTIFNRSNVYNRFFSYFHLDLFIWTSIIILVIILTKVSIVIPFFRYLLRFLIGCWRDLFSLKQN